MSKVTIDTSLCTGCGLCASVCPEVFDVADDNLAHVKDDAKLDCDLNDVASQCPVEAIKVE